MTRQIVEYTTRQAAEAAQLEIHEQMRATVPGYHADRWSEVHQHPKRANAFAITVKPRVLEKLKPADRGRVKASERDWWPDDPLSPTQSEPKDAVTK